MIFDSLSSHWLKRAEAYVQSNFRGLHPTLPDARKNGRGEVKSSGGCCHRTALACINCLITLPVFCSVRPIDVWRQRHMPQSLDHAQKIGDRTKLNLPLSKTTSGGYLCLKFVFISKEQMLAHTDLSSRPHQTLPLVWFFGKLPGQQDFQLAL